MWFGTLDLQCVPHTYRETEMYIYLTISMLFVVISQCGLLENRTEYLTMIRYL